MYDCLPRYIIQLGYHYLNSRFSVPLSQSMSAALSVAPQSNLKVTRGRSADSEFGDLVPPASLFGQDIQKSIHSIRLITKYHRIIPNSWAKLITRGIRPVHAGAIQPLDP